MKSLISRIILCLYVFINALFVDKYISRITSHHWLIAIAYMIGVCAVIWGINWLLNNKKFSTKCFWGILIFFPIYLSKLSKIFTNFFRNSKVGGRHEPKQYLRGSWRKYPVLQKTSAYDSKRVGRKAI